MGWLTPGLDAFSNAPIYLSRLLGKKKKFAMSTSTNGSHRAMVPIGSFERVMPMDIEPTFLLRALIVGDVEAAEKLGALELDEEDLVLCAFVCPGKADYGLLLRKNLDIIEKEG
jgi:Na+-transporting NADH:ubiquinone oxidoreductase subunit A